MLKVCCFVRVPIGQSPVFMMSKISHPSEFDFTQPGEWPEWRDRYVQFAFASELAEEEGDVRVNALVYCLGYDAEPVFQSFMLTEEQQQDFDLVLERFSTYFAEMEDVNSLRSSCSGCSNELKRASQLPKGSASSVCGRGRGSRAQVHQKTEPENQSDNDASELDVCDLPSDKKSCPARNANPYNCDKSGHLVSCRQDVREVVIVDDCKDVYFVSEMVFDDCAEMCFSDDDCSSPGGSFVPEGVSLSVEYCVESESSLDCTVISVAGVDPSVDCVICVSDPIGMDSAVGELSVHNEDSVRELISDEGNCLMHCVESSVPSEEDVDSVREVCPHSARENCGELNSVGEQGEVESVSCVTVSLTEVDTDVTDVMNDVTNDVTVTNVFDAVVCHMDSDDISHYKKLKKTLQNWDVGSSPVSPGVPRRGVFVGCAVPKSPIRPPDTTCQVDHGANECQSLTWTQ